MAEKKGTDKAAATPSESPRVPVLNTENQAVREIRRRAEPISLVFKDIKADFLKRAEGDVYFTCAQGREIAALVSRAAESEERVELPVQVTATVPGLSDEPVAEFILTLSLKKR